MKNKGLIIFFTVELFIVALIGAVFLFYVIDPDSKNTVIVSAEVVDPEPTAVPVGSIISPPEEKTDEEVRYGITNPEFLEKFEEPEAVPEEEPITLVFSGDTLLDRGVKNLLYNQGRDGVLSLEDAAPFINADIAMIDLEFPISSRGTPMPNKEYTFRGDPAHISFFTEMGIDIVTLANNHAIDYGYDAFLDTLDILDENGIRYVGGGRDLDDAMNCEVFEVKGKTIGILSASRVLPVVDWYAGKNKPGIFPTYDPTALNECIVKAKQECDYVIVYAHWGVEKQHSPEPYQVNMAHGYIDNGADAVIACHPHVLQGFEYYKGKPIAYSLGNFIFTDARKDTVLLTVTIEEDRLEMKLDPYRIVNLKTVPITDQADSDKLRAFIEDISFDVSIGEDWVIRAASNEF